jgi:[ribosomal protein S5]-alanine N-acetyltransferase
MPGWPAHLGPVSTARGAVELRPLHRSDGFAWQRLRIADESQLRRWDPSSKATWRERHTLWMWREHRALLRLAAHRGAALPFAITVDGQFVGQVTIGGIQRFPVHSGWIGYWVASPFTGRGVASTAVAMAVAHAFTDGQLHRLDATVHPDNLASRRVLTHLGFRQEGLLRRFLDVDGAWRDHELWALTVEDVPGGLTQLLAFQRPPVGGVQP